MKVAIGTVGSRGDVQPTVVLAQALQRAGHEVVVAAPEDFEDFVLGAGVPFRRLCGPFHELMPSGQEGFSELLRKLKLQVDEQFAAFPEVARGADLIVSGSGLFCGPSLAAHRGVPYRSLVYCPRTLPSAHHPSVSYTRASAPRWLNRLLWRVNDVMLQRITGEPISRWRARHGLTGAFRAYRDLMSERPLLCADPLLAPLPEDLVASTVQPGAIFHDDARPLPPELEAFLAVGEAPVYLGFGSVKDDQPLRTTRTLLEAVRRAGVRAVIHRGWAGLGDGPLPEGVIAVGPVSHARLLPRVRAMVHHGGAGTTHAAARAGVPQVVIPHLFDQFYWARRVHALGVAAAPLPKPQLSAERLSDALAWCLTDEARAAARALAPRLRTDAVARLVEELTGAVARPDAAGPARAA